MVKGIRTIVLSLSILLALCGGSSCKRQQAADRYQGMDTTLVRLYRQLEKHPNNAGLHMELSNYYKERLLLDSALNHALISIRLDSNNAARYVQLSDIYLAMRETDLCEEVLEKAIRLDKNNGEAYLKLAELHFLFRRYEEADDVISKVLEMNDYNPKAHFIQGWILREQGDTTAAIRQYMKAVEQNSTYFEAYEELAHLYHVRHLPLAVEHYKNALRIKPDDIQTQYNLAMFYQETGDNEKALDQYRHILLTNPDNRFVLHNMGWIYLTRLNDYGEAIRYFTRAIEQDTTYLEAVYNRGLAFEYQGDLQSARQDYAYTLHLDAKYEPAIEGLNRLDSKGKGKKPAQ